MAQVITFERYRPVPRYDATPWTEIQIEEGADQDDGPWTVIDTIAISPVDADPSEPAYQSFTTELASDTEDLWYRVIFADASGDTSAPTAAVQNVTGTATAVTPYATVDELARILGLRSPTAAQETAMERVLITAAGEIDSEIDLADGEALSGWQLYLVEQVNLDRAADLWHHTESMTGITGMLGDIEGGGDNYGRYSWKRYADRLAPLKSQWGLA